MQQEDWEKVVEIFERAIELSAPERENFLQANCPNEDLRREVEAMLAADSEAAAFIETPAVAGSSLSLFQEKLNAAGQTGAFENKKIGAFRLEREIGRGGMGTVYLAKRADGEFEQSAAVKLVRRGMDLKLVSRRFRQERQILADLNHPNIARLIDGGTTEDGMPYFVMEYVEGFSLRDFCERNDLTINQRLRLFEQVCDAVTYAHAQNVLHRDLKPNNILVKPDETVKLLDFGIAKLHNPEIARAENSEQSFMTRWLMTPEYASPEQARGEKLTPASDLYSLGVILYELVSGRAPYEFSSRAPHEIVRVICEATPKSLAAEGENLISPLLNRLILKALAKKPDERFGSVRELKNSIAAYLQSAPDSIKAIASGGAFKKTNSAQSFDRRQKTLAILPFKLLRSTTGEAADDFLSVGLADALTISLNQVRQIIVRPTGSVLLVAADIKDSLALGELLDVDFVLEGVVSPDDDRMRVAVQLLNIADNHVLWATEFEENESDVFALQDSIAEKVVSSLVPRLTESEEKRLQQRGTDNAAAFDSYLRGRYEIFRYEAEGITRSIRYFEDAVRLDPNFALAYAGIADYYNWMEVYSLMRPSESFPKAKAAAQKAVRLDPNLAEAYASLGFTVWGYDWDFAESERLYRRSIELNPNNPRAREWFAFLLQTVGRNDEAIAEMNAAQKLDPHSAAHSSAHHYVLFMARRYEEAERESRRGLLIEPENILCRHSFGWSSPFLGEIEKGIEAASATVKRAGRLPLFLTTLAYDLAIGGRSEEAREILGELEERERAGEFLPPCFFAVVCAGLGEIERAFARLDKNPFERDHWQTTLLIDPRLDILRSDERFDKVLKSIEPLSASNVSSKVQTPNNENSNLPVLGNSKLAAEEKSATVEKSDAPSDFISSEKVVLTAKRTIRVVLILVCALLIFVLLFVIFGNS